MKYIMTKVVTAEPMTDSVAMQKGIIDSPSDSESGEGFLVTNDEGHRWWQKKEDFEKYAKSIDSIQFDFGTAIEFLQQGKKVQRAGWNGKGMFLFLRTDGDDKLKYSFPKEDGNPETEFVDCEALNYICMKTADNKVVPWLASQTDILSKDWSLA